MQDKHHYNWRQIKDAKIRVKIRGYPRPDGSIGNGIGEYMAIDYSRIGINFDNDVQSLSSGIGPISPVQNN